MHEGIDPNLINIESSPEEGMKRLIRDFEKRRPQDSPMPILADEPEKAAFLAAIDSAYTAEAAAKIKSQIIFMKNEEEFRDQAPKILPVDEGHNNTIAEAMKEILHPGKKEQDPV